METIGSNVLLNGADLVIDSIERCRHLSMHLAGIVAGHHVGLVTVAAKQIRQLPFPEFGPEWSDWQSYSRSNAGWGELLRH